MRLWIKKSRPSESLMGGSGVIRNILPRRSLGWINKIQNVGLWCSGGSAIHVMSKLNRSHSASDCRWSVALMILLQMVILWHCLENHRWKKIGCIYETVYFQKSLDSFSVWFVLVASQKFSSHILLSFQWQDPPRWITFPLCQFSFLLSTVPMDNSPLLPVFHFHFQLSLSLSSQSKCTYVQN